MVAYYNMKLEVGKIIPINGFVKEPFYIKGLDCSRFNRERDLPRFSIYFANDKDKLRNTISGKQVSERDVASMQFKGGGKPINLFLPEIDKRWPVYKFCYLAIDRLTEMPSVYLLYEIRRE